MKRKQAFLILPSCSRTSADPYNNFHVKNTSDTITNQRQ